MTRKKEVHGTISSLPARPAIWRCPIGVGHDKERGSGMTREGEGQDGREKGFPERGAFGEWVLFDVMCLLLLSSYAADTGHIITGLIAVLSTDISNCLTINCSFVLICLIIRIIE